MAKPRIFVSSTYYDLKHIRKSIESFIDDMGYETVLFENGDIPFDHHEPLDESCYKELESCHILVLVVGGRYGSSVSEEQVDISDDELEKHYEHFNSITKKEYETAKERDIPIYIFVEKGVAAEYQTYKENRENDTIKYAHVDSVNVFRLLDVVYAQKRNNLVKEFENVEDITKWLKDQWAGLFTQFLIKKSNDAPIASLEKQLSNLSIVAETLKDYSTSIIRGLSPNEFDEIVSNIDQKEKHRSEMSLFLRHHIIDHLIEDHSADPESLFEGFINSKNSDEFVAKANSAMKDDDYCGLMEDSEFLFSNLNELREDLGLGSWPRITKQSKGRKKPRL
ncbi:DUF4062 domain-containing protein [Litoribrevibacter euphylliae]|uniref:DUF4062 domain-containing protein n=1 Tax=Litoribrevibacter euphylliae TaxID=1834034 RepID=A0ABV7HKS5_9GAMM